MSNHRVLRRFKDTLQRFDKRLWAPKSIKQCVEYCNKWSIKADLGDIKGYIKYKLPNRDVEEMMHTPFSALGNKSAYEYIEEGKDEYVLNDIMGLFRRMLG
ncbi:hypothetical protein UFOVP53_146 [uncultured Caudovirales phage]|uniref:Uncharacterized protein n=1 Tax=uncultured Caudovirales phage TaxID=2100421 RepID=A0A6J5KZC4_9CAUD|nr:hypothetical protein UFOVP53_146 [uncultured Caudovirales phage]